MLTTESASIASQVVQLQSELAEQFPDDVATVFADEQAQLHRAGVPARVTEVGSPLPDGELLDVRGRPTTLAEQLGGRPAVVVFYRGRGALTATSRFAPTRNNSCRAWPSGVSR
jgi:hypothetical protein